MTDFTGKSVFLSGPMTGRRDWNRAAFAQAESRLMELGAAAVFNPAKDAPHGPTDLPHSHYMLDTLHRLTQHGKVDGCNRPRFDVLVALPGWSQSAGARIEVDVAFSCGIEVVTW